MTTQPISETSTTFSLKSLGLKLHSEEDTKPHVEKLKSLGSVVSVEFAGNSLGVDACKSLAAALSQKPAGLQHCHFNDIFTGRLRSEIPQSLEFFVQALLKHHDSIELLDFSDNAFGPDGIRPLVPLIAACTRIKVLKVNNTGLGPEGGKLLAKALDQLAENISKKQETSQLEVVVCGRSRLETGSMSALSAALAKHTRLKELVLPQDGIRPDGIAILVPALAPCKDLEVLDLQDNTFTVPGCRALADSLHNWKNLRVLNISECLLQPKGFAVLLEVWKTIKMDQLELLDLRYNELNEKSFLALVPILKQFPSLQKLEMNGNCVEEDSVGISALRDVLDERLGSVSDMEEPDSEEEESEEGDEEEDEKEEEDLEDLEKEFSKAHIN